MVCPNCEGKGYCRTWNFERLECVHCEGRGQVKEDFEPLEELEDEE